MTLCWLPVLAHQGLRGAVGSLVAEARVCEALGRGAAGLLGSLSTHCTSISSSNSTMLLQHRHVAAAATASSAPAPTRQAPVQRAPTRLYAAQHKKPKGNSSSGSSRSSAAVPKELVLKAVPGIGKVYMQKLQEKGISSVDVLKESILSKLKLGETTAGFTPAVRYLQEELGIKRQDHAQRIVKHITAKFDGDLHSRLQEFEGLMPAEGLGTLPLTLCVEGNISAGKSTFLEYITNNNEELQQQLGVVHEPVDRWQRVPSSGGSTLNLLEKFYDDPQKYAYMFQNYVSLTRVQQARNSENIQQPVRLMERSMFSDRMVFVRAVRESGWMGDVELAVYDEFFHDQLKQYPTLVPDGFIYLKCTPNTCMERLKMRNRSEETTVSMDYLEGLHEKHEDWLGAGSKLVELQSRRRTQHAVLPNGLWLPGDISSNLRDSLYALDHKSASPEMHRVLNGVPALVLDVDRDVLRDLDLQRKVQETVADYITLMRQYREQRAKQLKQASRVASMQGSFNSSSSNRQQPLQQQDVPANVQQAIQLVTGTAAQGEFQVLPNSSGHLKLSGALEALPVAVTRSSQDVPSKLVASAAA